MPLTVGHAKHQISVAQSLLLAMQSALKFVRVSADNQLIYLLDYPELKAHWESRRPSSISQIGANPSMGVHRIYSYLLDLEEMILSLGRDVNDKEEELNYIQRSFDENAEFIDAICQNSQINTLITPITWQYLQGDIRFFLSFGKQGVNWWNQPINEAEQGLRSLGRENRSGLDAFRNRVEMTAFASMNRDRAANAHEVIAPFINHSNFHLQGSFPWKYYLKRESDEKSLLQALSEFDPSAKPDIIRYWSNWISAGNDLHNEATGSTGRWKRAGEGAETLYYAQFVQECLSKLTPNIKIAFVTRNRQYHDAQHAWQQQHPTEESDSRPLILHPRLLTAFMIRQGGDENPDIRFNQAGSSLEALRQLSGALDGVDSLIGLFSSNGLDTPMRSGLERMLRRDLRNCWDKYRREELAVQVQQRVIARKSRWGKRKEADPIRKFLQKVSTEELRKRKILRELYLMQPLLADIGWKDHFTIAPVTVTATENPGAYLFVSKFFTHPFRIHSKAMIDPLSAREGSNLRFGAMLKDAGGKLQTFLKSVEKGNVDEGEIAQSIEAFRFDLLLLIAIAFSISGRFSDARTFTNMARSVWGEQDDLDDVVFRQRAEVNYLEALLDRQEWRISKQDSERSPMNTLESGISTLEIWLERDKELCETFNAKSTSKRFEVFKCGFARELFQFAGKHNLKIAKKRWPLSILDSASKLLDLMIRMDDDEEFDYIKMRCRQQYLGFAKIVRTQKLTEKSKNEFSLETQIRVFDEFYTLLTKIRKSLRGAEDKLPVTVFVTAMAGIWFYRERNMRNLHEIQELRNIVEARRDPRDGRGYHESLKMLYQEIDK